MKVDDFPGFFLWPFHGAQWLHWCNGSPHPRCPRRAVVPSSQIWWPWSPAVSTVVSTKFIANIPENGKPRSSLSHVMYSLPISPKGALHLWAPWRWYSTLAQWVYWDHWNQRLKCYQPFTSIYYGHGQNTWHKKCGSPSFRKHRSENTNDGLSWKNTWQKSSKSNG